MVFITYTIVMLCFWYFALQMGISGIFCHRIAFSVLALLDG